MNHEVKPGRVVTAIGYRNGTGYRNGDAAGF